MPVNPFSPGSCHVYRRRPAACTLPSLIPYFLTPSRTGAQLQIVQSHACEGLSTDKAVPSGLSALQPAVASPALITHNSLRSLGTCLSTGVLLQVGDWFVLLRDYVMCCTVAVCPPSLPPPHEGTLQTPLPGTFARTTAATSSPSPAL